MNSPSAGSGYIEIPIDQVHPNPHNRGDRWVGDDEDLAFLETIRAKGVMEPLVVTPRPDGSYEIVAGERRWRASKELGLPRVPVVIRPDAKAGTPSEEMLIENHARKNLSAWETLTALIEAVEHRSSEAKLLGLQRPSMEVIAHAIGIPKRMAQRYYTVDGKLDEATRVAIASSAVLRRSLSMADLERIGSTHNRERTEVLQKLEELYRHADSPNKARRTGAAAAASTRRSTFGVKVGGVMMGKCTISPDPSADFARLYQPVVELDLKLHPLANLDDPTSRAQLIDHVRKVTSKVIKAIELGQTETKPRNQPTERGDGAGPGASPDGGPGDEGGSGSMAVEGDGDSSGLIQS